MKSRRLDRCRSSRDAAGVRAKLSDQTDPAGVAESSGRSQRHAQPHHGGEDGRHPRRQDRHRQSRRRRRPDRRRARGARRTGRLHAADGLGLDALVCADHVAQDSLRPDQGFCADLHVRGGAKRAGGQSLAGREQREGPGGARQEGAGHNEIRVRRRRLDQPFCGRHVRQRGGHRQRDAAPPLQGRRGRR